MHFLDDATHPRNFLVAPLVPKIPNHVGLVGQSPLFTFLLFDLLRGVWLVIKAVLTCLGRFLFGYAAELVCTMVKITGWSNCSSQLFCLHFGSACKFF